MKKRQKRTIVLCVFLLTCVLSIVVFAYEWHCYNFLPEQGCSWSSKGCDASRVEQCIICCIVGEIIDCNKVGN
jgi:hypothetical protein